MKPFKPSEEYTGLLKQARALYQLVCSNEKILSFYRKRIKELEDKERESSKEFLDSERAMNAVLTGELEEAENEILKLKERLSQYEIRS